MNERGSSPGRVNVSPSAQGRIPSQLQSDLCSLEDRVGALDKKWDAKFDKYVSQIEQITTRMSKLMANMGKLSGGKDITRNRSPSPLSKRVSSPCFGCGEVGHFKKECPKRVNALPERQVTFAEQSQAEWTNGTLNPLNLKGATREAISRPL